MAARFAEGTQKEIEKIKQESIPMQFFGYTNKKLSTKARL
jgi:hypothetical protein